MQFFTATLVALSVAAAAAGPARLAARGNSDINKCWQAGNSGTDANAPWVSQCTSADNKDFPSFTTIGGNSLTTQSHVTLGPWHCCAGCMNNANCVAWFMDDYCNCVYYLDNKCSSGGASSTLSGPTSGNQTLTFHPGGCKV